MTYRRYQCPEDFKPTDPDRDPQDPNRRLSVGEIEMAFRYVCIHFKKQWKLTGKRHVRRVSLKGRWVEAAIKGSNCWVYLKLDGWNKAFLFPLEMVQAVCFYLEINPDKVISKDYTKVYPKLPNPKGPAYFTYYLKHIHNRFDPLQEVEDMLRDQMAEIDL